MFIPTKMSQSDWSVWFVVLQGSVDNTRVTTVRWVPGSDNQFVSSHRSGNLYVWSTNENPAIKVHTPQSFVQYRELLDAKIYAVKQKQKCSLLYCWKIGHGSINAFAFSPDSEHIAIVSQDGFLRVYNFKEHSLYGRMRSYFGGLLCVCWSPDGKYVVTGGEDDLVTVWSFDYKRVMARGEGHKSYVTTVAFDPYMTILPSGQNSPINPHRESPTSAIPTSTKGEATSSPGHVTPNIEDMPDAMGVASSNTATPLMNRRAPEAAPPGYTAYRLGSIGQDTQLCLWDLSGDTLSTRRFHRGRSRATRQYSRPVSTADLGSEVVLPSGTDSPAVQGEEGKKGKEAEAEQSAPTSGRKEKMEEKGKPGLGSVGSSGEGQSAGEKSLNSQANHSELKERSPSVSVSSTSSNTSKKGRKKKKEKGEKGDKEKKLVAKSTRKTLRDPMKKVVGKLANTFGVSTQTVSHNRGQMGNFETCCSDDIAPKMSEVNHMEPLVAEKISQERLSALVFREDCFLTACQEGLIQTWTRPGTSVQDSQGKGEEEGEGEGEGWRRQEEVDEANQHRPMYSSHPTNSGVSPTATGGVRSSVG